MNVRNWGSFQKITYYFGKTEILGFMRKPDFSFGCDGSGTFSGIADDKAVLGFPAEMLPESVDAGKIITQAPGS